MSVLVGRSDPRFIHTTNKNRVNPRITMQAAYVFFLVFAIILLLQACSNKYKKERLEKGRRKDFCLLSSLGLK